jgi:signal transduction histidine kinase
MLLKRWRNIGNTLAFRLTLLYAGIFFFSTFVALFIVYYLSAAVVIEATDRELLNEHEEFALLYIQQGLEAIKAEVEIEADTEDSEETFYRLFSSSGTVLATTDISAWSDLSSARTGLNQLGPKEEFRFLQMEYAEHPYDIRVMNARIGPDLVLQIGLSLEKNAYFIESFRKIFSVTMIMVLVFAAVVGWFLAKKALTGVAEVSRTAVKISDGALDLRVPIKDRGNEIENLAKAFNQMLDRIQNLISKMAEMTDNIAHDLKSPLTRMRGMAELSLNNRKSDNDSQALASKVVEDCDRLLQMINTMLDISETEAGATKFDKQKVDIALVLRDMVELYRPVAEDNAVTILTELPNGCYANVDLQSFQRMTANLLDNAFKYTSSGGTVTVVVRNIEPFIQISIQDTGVGISEQDLPQIFQRLYRSDGSRSQPGFGLGLSLALAIAKSHGGNILAKSTPAKGSTFVITLPFLNES